MPRRPTHAPLRRHGLLAPLVALLALTAAPRLQAQTDSITTPVPCTIPGGEENQSQPVCNLTPRVFVTPGSAVVSQPVVQVSVTASDHLEPGPLSFSVRLNGQDVTAAWTDTTWTGGQGTGAKRFWTASGQVVLSAANRVDTLAAEVCDAETCRTSTAVYTLSTPGVEVRPDAFATTVVAAATASHAFRVINRGTQPATFLLSASCTNEQGQAVAGCGVSPGTVPLAPGDSAAATATYPATQVGSALAVKVIARQQGEPGVQDAGWVDVTPRLAQGTRRVAPLVTLVPLNAGATVERGQCVTAALTGRAALECGDLRVVHALPAHRTRGRGWAPVLLYNSQHAHPTPTVYADVTVPDSTLPPASVEMVVTLAGGVTHRASFTGPSFVPGLPRRIGVQWDGIGMETGLYAYQVQVISHYGDGPRGTAPLPGELAVVNRSSGYLGAGWWVAGVERLHAAGAPGSNRLLWVGGDGSTRVYEPLAGGPGWVAQHPGRGPDTLAATASGYARRLPGGGTVHFTAGGLHERTVSRTGLTTGFRYGTLGLEAIYVPGQGAGGQGTGDPAWTFAWDYTAQQVRSVAATVQGAAARTTLVNQDASRRVVSLQDPDGRTVSFGYSNTAAPYRVTHQRDKRGTFTFFGYDANGRLTLARTQLGASANAAVDLTRQFIAVEGRGVGSDGATGAGSVAASQATTYLDGPRTGVSDHTYLWHTGTGAVRRVRDAAGAQTTVRFEDPRFPALATEVVSPSGLRSTAEYDTRGRVVSAITYGPIGGGMNDTTTYAWDNRWNAPTMIAGRQTGRIHIAYDSVTGNRLWQRQGESDARRVDFAYHPAGHPQAGQLESVTAPAATPGAPRAVERVTYDAWGNVRTTVSPLGFRTLTIRDALGRDSIVYAPPADSAGAVDTVALVQRGARQAITYDAMGRPLTTVSTGPGIRHGYNPAGTFRPDSTGPESLTVVTEYDPEGAPLKVTRTISPNPAALAPQITGYAYDAAGRKTREWTGANLALQQWEYDQAGNVTAWINPREGRTTSEYDAAGRLTRQVTPTAAYPQQGPTCTALTNISGYACTATFPVYSNDGSGYTIPEEWTTFRYDSAGNMVFAQNADAIVERTYHPNGAVYTDRLRIRDLETSDFTTRSYEVTYGYHVGTGTLSSLGHPENLAGSARWDQFAYDPVTSALTALQDRNGNYFEFRYDLAGRPTGVGMPGNVADSMRYDLEGRLRWRRETLSGGATLQGESLAYDARGKLVRVDTEAGAGRGGASTYTQWYSGLGNLVATDWGAEGTQEWQREEYRVDPLGNVLRKRTWRPGMESPANDHPDFAYTLNNTFGRVTAVSLVDIAAANEYNDETRRGYDASGNAVSAFQLVEGPGETATAPVVQRSVQSRSYYGHDERLRLFVEYDSRYSNAAASNTAQDLGVWEEYRYDPLGRRVAVRTRREAPLCAGSPDTCISATTYFVWSGDQLLWEIRTASGSKADEAGGRVSYTHAGGIDRPLVIWKQGVGSIVTHQNWRGQFATGTFGAGSARVGQMSDCETYPPSNGCVPVSWPGWNTTPWHEGVSEPSATGYEHYWLGSLAVGMRDASGLLYMRNRYYDPQTAQFTQMDPIGLAGGLNSYGFAAGDPVSYSDPYGLNPCILYPKACDIVAGAAIGAVVGAAAQAISNAANDRPLTEGVTRATLEGGAVGGALGGVGTVVKALRGASLADDAAHAATTTATATRTFLREGDAVLGVVHEGRLIAHTTNVTLGHAQFIERTIGILPAGAEAVTIGKLEGVITVMRSRAIHGQALPASREAFEAAKALFR